MGKVKVNNTILEIIGNNIKTIRLSKRITQEQIAEKLNRSVNFVSLIELGKSGMSVQTIVDLCNILDISTESIFKGLINYNLKNQDKLILDNLSILNNNDKEIVINLMNYIIDNK